MNDEQMPAMIKKQGVQILLKYSTQFAIGQRGEVEGPLIFELMPRPIRIAG